MFSTQYYKDTAYYERKRKESSQKCFDDLSAHGLIKPRMTSFSFKAKGAMEGLVLFGETKAGRPKSTYIKGYQSFYDGTRGDQTNHAEVDYAIFRILKQCGAKSPKVKLKKTPDNSYIFSCGMTTEKKLSLMKHYWYFDRGVLPYKIDWDQLELAPNDLLDPPIKKSIAIDKMRLIRLVILASVLQLYDIDSSGNVGFVLNKDDERVKAKLACIDFYFLRECCPSYSKFETLKQFICNKAASLFNAAEKSIEKNITEDDCQHAFEYISMYFLPTCVEIETQLDELCSGRGMVQKKLSESINIWRKNFDNLCGQMDEWKNTHAPQPEAHSQPSCSYSS